MSTCTVEGCLKKVQARGWCNTHYWQNYVGREPGSEGQRERSARLRQEAINAGDTTYETGLPCPNGHVGPRKLSGHCVACVKERNQVKYAKNPEQAKRANANWVAKNKDRMKELGREWTLRNRGRKNEQAARRRAAAKRAMPAWADRDEIRAIYARAKELGMEVDHIVPLQSPDVCGLHVGANLQLLPRFENRSKGNKLVKSVRPTVWVDGAGTSV